ncbi:MAG TPA: helix-turn-helix transcriptional regulator [Fimbriiglobus sp.]
MDFAVSQSGPHVAHLWFFEVAMASKNSAEKRLSKTVRPNGPKLKSLRRNKALSQAALAERIGHNVRTIENAERGKQRIQEEILAKIAKELGCSSEDVILGEDSEDGPVEPGTPEYYLRAIIGKWRSIGTDNAGKNRLGVDIPERTFEWEGEFVRDRIGIAGTFRCVTQGYEYAEMELRGTVNGLGIVMVEGFRNTGDGGVHLARLMLEYQCDGKTKSMVGGYVHFNLEHQRVFYGPIVVKPV